MADRVVVAPRDSGIAAVAALRLDLLAAMDKAGPDDTVVLDLGGIGYADSAFAQLVIAFKHEASLQKQRIAIKGEDSKNSVSALLCCDAVCETCLFNDFSARVSLATADDIPLAQAMIRTASKTKRSKA